MKNIQVSLFSLLLMTQASFSTKLNYLKSLSILSQVTPPRIPQISIRQFSQDSDSIGLTPLQTRKLNDVLQYSSRGLLHKYSLYRNEEDIERCNLINNVTFNFNRDNYRENNFQGFNFEDISLQG